MLKNRFRKYLPVVVDIETGGFDPKKNAILEIAITLIEFENGNIIPESLIAFRFDNLVDDEEDDDPNGCSLHVTLRVATTTYFTTRN